MQLAKFCLKARHNQSFLSCLAPHPFSKAGTALLVKGGCLGIEVKRNDILFTLDLYVCPS